MLGRAAGGELLTTRSPTLSAWLESWYRTHQQKRGWSPATVRLYRDVIDKWLVPALGTVQLEKLRPAVIQQWTDEVTQKGGRQIILTAHTVLRSALRWAMAEREVTYNAAQLVIVPQPERAEKMALSAAEAVAFLSAAQGHRLEALFVLATTLGLRLGEVTGLTWKDVDLEAGTVKVRQQLQFERTGELVPLKTVNSPFSPPEGRYQRPNEVRAALSSLLTAAGLRQVGCHDLRHTAATLLLADKAPLFDVSRILGHASVKTTADVYGHLVEDMTAGAALQMDAILASARARGVR